MDNNETKQARALRLLEELYKLTADTGNPVHSTKLAATIGSSEAEALEAYRYLKQNDLINTLGLPSATGTAIINDTGSNIIENAKRHPNDPIPVFGITYNNTFHITQMTGSGIQVGGPHSTQHQTTTYNSQDLDDLKRAIEILAQRIDELKLDDAAKKTAQNQIDTIKAQLTDDKPNSTIIREAGKTLRSVIEGAIGGLLTEGITHWRLVHDVLMRITS